LIDKEADTTQRVARSGRDKRGGRRQQETEEPRLKALDLKEETPIREKNIWVLGKRRHREPFVQQGEDQ